jgi:hypothetical protein
VRAIGVGANNIESSRQDSERVDTKSTVRTPVFDEYVKRERMALLLKDVIMGEPLRTLAGVQRWPAKAPHAAGRPQQLNCAKLAHRITSA